MTRHRSRRNAFARVLIERWTPAVASKRDLLDAAGLMILADEAWERADRVRRIQAAVTAKRLEGNWYAGTPPYGWRSVGLGRLEPIPAELRVVEWMCRQRNEGWGWAAITSRLNDNSTPGPAGRRWHASTVRRIVARGTENPAMRVGAAAGGDREAGEG